VFTAAWANFVIELFTTHLLAAALGEGQRFVDLDLVFHFLSFSFLSLIPYIDIIPARL